MSLTYLDFEQGVAQIDAKIKELRAISASQDSGVEIQHEIDQLQNKSEQALAQIYKKLSPWQKTLVARHPQRPRACDYISELFTEFTPLYGDRYFKEDAAILSGMARINEVPCIVFGQEKGKDTKTRLKHNFGMARPEGYRKAVRLMDIAQRFSLPVISFIDTSGAYPGVGAEERGQSEAIARSTEACLRLEQPNIAVIIGEGGSGGAIALATANYVMMLEHAVYSVISPEGAASILWRDGTKAQDAAEALRITAQDLKRLGVIDDIVDEPLGGAQRNPQSVYDGVRSRLLSQLEQLQSRSPRSLRYDREEKFLAIGRFLDAGLFG